MTLGVSRSRSGILVDESDPRDREHPSHLKHATSQSRCRDAMREARAASLAMLCVKNRRLHSVVLHGGVGPRCFRRSRSPVAFSMFASYLLRAPWCRCSRSGVPQPDPKPSKRPVCWSTAERYGRHRHGSRAAALAGHSHLRACAFPFSRSRARRTAVSAS